MRQLQSLVLMILFTYVPIVIAIGGVLVSIRAFLKRRNSGFLVIALVFVKPILEQLIWWIRVRNFVPVQVDADTWTAPVRHVDVWEPVFLAVLLLGVSLLYRRYPTERTIARGSAPGVPPEADS